VQSVSVIIPVRDGERWLGAVLAAVRAQGEVELIVIDSGSRDRSPALGREAGAELIQIDPGEFGHGRTRNLGAERSSGELICFLTQDAEPVEGWLAAHRESFELAERVGASYGPHLPRPDTSPMIARELEEFFAGFEAPGGGAAVQRGADPAFLSNVNACYARACWQEMRFPDLEYSEDQAFGRAMLAAGWTKVYNPGAGVLHAHDYGPLEFMKRYFDEYRGLREASGHIEPFNPLTAARNVGVQVKRDAAWMRERGWAPGRRARWSARAAAHHGGRSLMSTLGSRSDRLPGAAKRAFSLERRGSPAGADDESPVPRGRQVVPRAPTAPHEEVLRLSREGPAPLDEPVPGMADRDCLHIAVAIPPFMRGSGGHNTIFTLIERLERMGHTCSIWVHDPRGQHGHESGAVLRGTITESFQPVRAPVFKGFDDWRGADVVVATGWETAYPVMLLEGCRARAYMINDHEPEFFATSAEKSWAQDTYTLGMFGISASRWLRDLLAREYGQEGTWFRLGVDEGLYRQRPVERRRDTVVFYAREFTARRAVPLGALALTELYRRRPDLRFVLFGQAEDLLTPFPYEQIGIASPEVLSWHYSEATVGLCLSLTNYSLIPQEMMACGLPCVDLAGGSSEAEFGRDGPAELAESKPVAVAVAIERLLEDRERWSERSAAGLAFVETASWDVAAKQVEAGLREALRRRQRAASPEAPRLR
jgi:glycosyltransferase involved in cell wall biosynthesis